MDSVAFYRSFHTNTANKAIHLFCIPLIVLSTINFLSKISTEISCPFVFIWFRNRNIGQLPIMVRINLIHALYVSYFFMEWSWQIGLVMQAYIALLASIGHYWRRHDKNWFINNCKVFAFAWTMQFIGHAIEGNRPALMTSLRQTIFQAPLFTLEYIYPPLLQN